MSRRAALQSAARWALREDDQPLRGDMPPASPEIVATLDDPALAEALTQVAGLGRLSDEDVRAMRSTRRRALASGVTALLLFGIGLGGWANGWFAADPVVTQHFETRRGQRLQVALADGSTITLNGATSLDVRLEEKQRLVDLRGGQAYFDVAHDATRPFAVHAGESNTRVLGTAFDVDMGHGTVRLAVYRGKVRFGRYSAQDGVVVPAGWQSRFAGGGASTPTRFDAAQSDWRQDWINTDALVLDDLVEALNRQGGPLIAPPPPSLARIALAGRFRLDDPRNLLGAIGAAYGFAVVEEHGELRLVPDNGADENQATH